jgi:signal transduction histidine kinase
MLLGMQALELGGNLDEGQQQMLGITRRGGETLIGMINDLLGISKMESGALQLERQEIRVTDMIDAAVKQVATLANAKNLTLAIGLEPRLPRLVADEAKLLRTLVNLLSNAIKFSPAGGTVTVAVRPDNDPSLLLFSVTDTGEGIPSEAFGRIFEKFGQVESRQAGRFMSTGLGLTFCKLAVEAHGGHIGVESAPGQGSTFCFTIPVPSQPE